MVEQSISATKTPLPNLFEFHDMFSNVAFSTEDTLLPPPRVPRAVNPHAPPRPVRPSYNSPAPPKSFLAALFARKEKKKPWKPSPYPRLKTGRRAIIVVIVDNGTTSFLRFSEAEFGKLPIAGMKGRSS